MAANPSGFKCVPFSSCAALRGVMLYVMVQSFPKGAAAIRGLFL